MGITYIPGTVTGPNGQRTLDFLVDSGATYTLLPFDIWQAIGLAPKRTVTFALADGTKLERAVSDSILSAERCIPCGFCSRSELW